MSHFYLALPSNSSMQCYRDNTATKYTTKLPQMMELEGDWEVGLVEIACPGRLINIEKLQCGVRVRRTKTQATYYFTLKEGHHRHIYDFVYATNEVLLALGPSDRMVQMGHLRYNESEAKVNLRVKRDYAVKFNADLAERLGFTSTDEYSGSVVGSTPAPSGINVRSLYVYCDLLESVPVGDVKVPLLRIINMDKPQEYMNMYKIMRRVLFLPVQKKHFDTIEIQILDNTGNVVPFEDGKSIVVLEFRRAAHPYFLGNV